MHQANSPRRMIKEIIDGKRRQEDDGIETMASGGTVMTLPYKSVSPSGSKNTPSQAEAKGKMLDLLSAEELAELLADEKFTTATTEAIVTLNMNARELKEVCMAESADQVLESELGIKSGLMKGKFKAIFLSKDYTQENSHDQAKEGSVTPSAYKDPLAMEAVKKMKFPMLPKPEGKASSINSVQWRIYGIGCCGQIKAAAPFLSQAVVSIFDMPNQDLSGVGELFSEIDTLCDQIWFNQTVTQDELPRILEQCLVSKEMFQLNGKDSGLLLHATMHKQINKKTSTRARLLIRSAISRAPVTDPCNLLQELVDIQGLFNEMCQQGTAPEPQIRMSILDNAISKLKANPKLTLILVNPVYECLKENPEDPDVFMETLKDCAEDINTNPEFKEHGVGYQSGDQRGKNFKEKKFMRRSYQPSQAEKEIQAAIKGGKDRVCKFYRDIGSCENGDACPLRHERSGQECKNASYLECGICDNYKSCTDYHKWNKEKFGPKIVALEKFKEKNKKKEIGMFVEEHVTDHEHVQMCRNFQFLAGGICSDGPKCPYSHRQIQHSAYSMSSDDGFTTSDND